MARKGRGRQKQSHLVDMPLPAEERGRRSGGRAADPVPAQMQRGNTRHGRARRRDWERKMRRERLAADVLDADGQRVDTP